MKSGPDLHLSLPASTLRLAAVSALIFACGLLIGGAIEMIEDEIHGSLVYPIWFFLFAMWVAFGLIPAVIAWGYRISLDDNGIYERIGPLHRQWPWREFESGGAIPIRGRMAFRFPESPWWKRRVSFDHLGERGLVAYYAALDRCPPSGALPAPEQLQLRFYLFPMWTLVLTRDGCEVRRLRGVRRFAWTEAERIVLFRKARRCIGGYGIEFRFGKRRYIFNLCQNDFIDAWKGATANELEGFLEGQLGDRVLHVALLGPPQTLGELKYREQRDRERLTAGYVLSALVSVMIGLVIFAVVLVIPSATEFADFGSNGIALYLGIVGLTVVLLIYSVALPLSIFREQRQLAKQYASWRRELAAE